MPLIFEVVFWMAVISRIESIGGGRVRSRRRDKANIQAQMAVLCYHLVAQTATTQVCRPLNSHDLVVRHTISRLIS